MEQNSSGHMLLLSSPLGLSCLPNGQLPRVECGIVKQEGWPACQPVLLEPAGWRLLTATPSASCAEHPNPLSLGGELFLSTWNTGSQLEFLKEILSGLLCEDSIREWWFPDLCGGVVFSPEKPPGLRKCGKLGCHPHPQVPLCTKPCSSAHSMRAAV